MEGSSSLDKTVLRKSNKNDCEKNYGWMLGQPDCSAWLSLRWAFTGRLREQLLVRWTGGWLALWAGSGDIQLSCDTGIQEMLLSYFSWLTGCEDTWLAPSPLITLTQPPARGSFAEGRSLTLLRCSQLLALCKLSWAWTDP